MSAMRPFDPTAPLNRGVTLIEASAGTGKTYTITSLFLRLIVEEGLGVDQILVVTFTEAATAELRDRVRGRLRSALEVFRRGEPAAVDDPLVAGLVDRAVAKGEARSATLRLESALVSFDAAAISTIHGFCHRVLQENAFESGVPFGAELLTDEGPLLDEVVRDFWTRELHDVWPDFYRYLVSSSRAKKHLKLDLDRLSELARKVCSQRAMGILPEQRPALPERPDPQAWAAAVAQASLRLEGAREQILAVAEASGLNKTLLKKVPDHLGALERWLGGGEQEPRGLPKAAEKLRASYLTAKTRKKGTPPEHPFFHDCDQLCELAAAQDGALEPRALDLLMRFVPQVRSDLSARKLERSYLSFDDLLHHLADALEADGGAHLSQAISNRYQAVLIDEFQDTDPIQYEIFDRVFGDARGYLFLIGDPKQAIYSFRGADIYAYLQAVRAAGERTFTLETNWRSDGRLVSAFERLFTRIDAPFVDRDIRFISVAANQPDDRLQFPDGPRPPLCLRFARAEDFPEAISGQQSKVQRLKKTWANERLPEVVAVEVAELLAAGATIDGRSLQPGDVAVLVRKNEQARQVQAALRELRIPSVLHSAASVFHSAEAEELRTLLAAVAEPSNSTRVRAALATATLGMTAEVMADLEANERAWEREVERFRELHRLWTERGFMKMFRALVERGSVTARVLARVDGERRLTNLLHLGELIHRQEVAARLGVAGLLRWYDLQRQSGGDDVEASQLRLESDEHAVQLVTIHKSKGLQYSVVICPYLWDGTTLHPRDQVHPRFHDPDDQMALKMDLGSDHYEEHVERAVYEARTEGLRLLYVALTRARHRCVVYTGALSEVESSPVGYLLHGPAAGDGPEAFAQSDAVAKAASSEQLWGEVEALAAASDGTIEAAPLTLDRAEPFESQLARIEALATRRQDRPLQRSWRVASFTALTTRDPWAAAVAEGPEVEEAESAPAESAPAAPVKALAPEAELGKVTLHEFPKGTEAGTCLHSVLELADFRANEPAALERLSAERLRAFGFDSDRLASLVAEGLSEALRTPLDEAGFTLGQISAEQRLDEMEFLFPVAQAEAARRFDPATLSAVFERHRSPVMPVDYPAQVSRLGFEPITGFMMGFIDLVYLHDDRWYVVDYKSNYLGDWYESYAEPRLIEAMADHHYYLQYHLYTVALHRFLRWQLGSSYDYERDMGGVYYLFLRGMSPQAGAGCGVFRDRPSAALIEELSERLRQGAGGER